MAAHECYIVMLEMNNHLQALNIEEKKVTVEPTEDLEEISLDDDTPYRTTRIGTQVDPLVCNELALFLKKQSRHLRLEPRGHARDQSQYHGTQA